MECQKSSLCQVQNGLCLDAGTMSCTLGFQASERGGCICDGSGVHCAQYHHARCDPLHSLIHELHSLFGTGDLPFQTYFKVFELTIDDSMIKAYCSEVSFLQGTCDTKEQIADCMTKGLEKTLFQQAWLMLTSW